MAEESIDTFLSGLQGRLLHVASKPVEADVIKADPGLSHATTLVANPIIWATSPEWLGVQSLYTHVRQYQIIRDFFQIRCPLAYCNGQSEEDRDCWGKGRQYLESENLLEWSDKYNDDVCPHCGTTRSEFIQDKLLRKYNQFHLVVGMRGGKTSVSAVMGTYVEHVMTVLGHRANGLDKYFNQLPGQKFDITFVASTDVQSKDTIWAKFTELRRNSTWYGKYARWIKQQEISQKTPSGIKPLVYEELDKEIKNDFIGLKLSSLNSNSGGMAGRTRISSFIDELARFEITDSSRSADEVYRVLDNSLATVRGAVINMNLAHKWLGTMASISSPISIEDKSMTLLRQCPAIDNMYYGHYATWDFNPELPRSSFDSVFQRDPIGAMRDYGAAPPSAASPLITDPVAFRAVTIQQDLKPTATFRQLIHTDRIGRDYISLAIDGAQLSRDGERYLAFDAGSTFDQFAGACAHGEWVTTPEGRQLVTVFDWIIRILPEAKPRRDVWFDFVIQIVEYLRKYYTISRIEFDRWQSTYLIQQIRDRGVACEMKGTDYDQFCKFVNDANFSKVRMLPPAPNDFQVDPTAMTPAGLAFYELERLERDMDNKKVWNPRKGQRRGWNSDDVATVIAHANDMVQSSVIDLDNSNSRKAKLHRESASGTSWSDRGSIYRPMINKRGW